MSLKQIFSRSYANAPSQMKALLVWELGAGFTHLQNIFGVARHLRRMNVECIIATADTRLDAWFRSIGCKTLQSYLWPVMRHDMALPQQRQARVFSDILANFGLCEPGNFESILSHYSTVFDLVRPDILLCENAFGAALAARGRIPTVLFGSTLMMLPPVFEEGFAPIDSAYPEPAWSVGEVLDSLNAGLGNLALPPMRLITDILDCAAVLPFGPSAFDPYKAYRSDHVLSPHCPDLPQTIDVGANNTVFVYLHRDVQFIKAVMDALIRLPKGSRIYIQSLSKAWQQRLSKRGLVIEPRMLSLEEIAREANCLLHQGGVTLTAAAMAMAIPQIILARSRENEIAGRFVSERELGRWHAMPDTSSAALLASIEDVSTSRSIKKKLQAKASVYRAWFKDDPTRRVANEVAKILKLPEPSALEPFDHRIWSPV